MRSRTVLSGGRRSGFVFIAFTLALFLILGSIGLSVDIGRMYIVRSESQSFCDAAALAAAWELNGTADGITAARNAAFAVQKHYHLGTTAFDPARITVEFAEDPPTTWVSTPASPGTYWIARVTTSADLPMYFMPVVTGSLRSTIGASASSKKIPLQALSNFFPFAPYWQPPNFPVPPGVAGTPTENSVAADPPDPFGMIPARIGAASGAWQLSSAYTYQQGGIYTLRGPGNITYSNLQNSMCPNDATLLSAEYRDANGQPDRGFLSYDTGSADQIRGAIVADDPLAPPGETLMVGESTPPASGGCDQWCLVNGTKEAEVKAIWDRINLDSNTTATNYNDYVHSVGGAPNGMRVVVVPIVTANCGTGYTDPHTGLTVPDCPTYPPDAPGSLGGTTATSNVVLGWAGYFLLPQTDYPMGASNPICAEYIGPWLGGPGGGSGGGNVTEVVLVQ